MRFGFDPTALGGIATIAAMGLAGCHPTGFELSGSEYHSANFDYLFHPTDTTVCPSVMDSLEEHRALISSYLHIDPDSLPPVTYFKMRDEREYLARCTVGGDGAANAGKDYVVSPVPFDEHELIHTITLGAWGFSTRFLEEGIAVALSCDPAAVAVTDAPYNHWSPQFDSLGSESSPASVALYTVGVPATITNLYDIDVSGNAGYSAAGAVTTYLLDSGSVDKLAELWAHVSMDASESDFSAALENVYGFSLEEVWQSLQTTRHRPCAPVWMCSLPEITNNGAGTLRSSCTGKDLGRPTGGNLRLQYPGFSADVYAAEDGTLASEYVIPVTGVSLIPCTGDPADYLPRDPDMQLRILPADLWLPALATPHVVTLETNAWVLQSLQYDYTSPAGQMPYGTAPLAPATTRCSEAVANAIPSMTASALWLPNDAKTHYARFHLQVESTGNVNAVPGLYAWSPELPPPPGINALFCQGCNGDIAADCDGCPLGTTDCVVTFQNTTNLPTWLRIATGDHDSSDEWWAEPDAGPEDAGLDP
jgi:hypothetical protein